MNASVSTGQNSPVELRNVPSDLELTGDPTNEVEVRLRASPGIIQRIGPILGVQPVDEASPEVTRALTLESLQGKRIDSY